MVIGKSYQCFSCIGNWKHNVTIMGFVGGLVL